MSQENGTKRIFLYDKRRIHHQCKRKKGFATTREANKVIHKTRAESGIKLSYYKCEYCGKYHLTKKYVTSKF